MRKNYYSGFQARASKVVMDSSLSLKGISLVGHFPRGTTYKEIVEVFDESNGGRVDAEWIGKIDNEVFTIYTYKTKTDFSEVEDITDWHIGGKNEEVAKKVLDYFDSQVEGEEKER